MVMVCAVTCLLLILVLRIFGDVIINLVLIRGPTPTKTVCKIPNFVACLARFIQWWL